MLNVDNIKSGFVQFTAEMLSNYLATNETPEGDLPAVAKHRFDGLKLPKPFITIDISTITVPSGWLLNRYFDDQGNDTYEVMFELFIDWRCYGDNSEAILQHLNTLTSMPAVRDRLHELAGVTKSRSNQIVSTPDLLSTKHEEGALMVGTFYITDTVVNPIQASNGWIEFYDSDGVLITGVNGDIPVRFTNVPDPDATNTLITADSTDYTADFEATI